jgi:hypothetical protein
MLQEDMWNSQEEKRTVQLQEDIWNNQDEKCIFTEVKEENREDTSEICDKHLDSNDTQRSILNLI